MRTSSCFSTRWFRRISSVSAEQQQTCATNYPRILLLWETCSTWSFGTDRDSYWPFCWRKKDQCTATVKLGARVRTKIRKVVRRPEITPNYVLMRVWNLSKKGQYFYTVDTEEEQQAQHVCLEYTMPRIEKGDSYKRMDSQEYENRPSLEHKKVCYHDDRYSIEVQIPSLFGDSSASWVGIVNVLIRTWQNRCWPRRTRT